MSEAVATFIYKTANPFIKRRAEEIGDTAYIQSFKARRNIAAWKDKFEELMSVHGQNKEVTFTFTDLEEWYKKREIQDRYFDITEALYLSLAPHYQHEN
jgi:hypothetical protein